jgi:hypothetical protein
MRSHSPKTTRSGSGTAERRQIEDQQQQQRTERGRRWRCRR